MELKYEVTEEDIIKSTLYSVRIHRPEKELYQVNVLIANCSEFAAINT